MCVCVCVCVCLCVYIYILHTHTHTCAPKVVTTVCARPTRRIASICSSNDFFSGANKAGKREFVHTTSTSGSSSSKCGLEDFFPPKS